MTDTQAYHILLIGEDPEPDPEILSFIKNPDATVLYATSGSDALSQGLEYNIRLIIVDLAVIDRAQFLRSSNRFKDIPILILLQQQPEPDWEGPDMEGPADYLVKPLNRYLVKQKISMLVQFGNKDLESEEDTQDALKRSKRELEEANMELQRLTEDLEEAIEKANQMAVEAELATISKSGFLATMSHEIRTPLNAVIGFTELVLGTPLNDEQKEYIDSIRSASNTFLDLINDILDYSKIEADMIQLESIPFSFEACLHDVMGTMWMRAYEKQLNLAYRIAPDVPCWVSGDPTRFKQILVNLVGNAIKFTGQGQIIIRLELESIKDDACKVHLTVSDSGIGIPESKWAKLFQPFCQVGDSTSREYGGTGLGLAISKKLSEQMDGRIWIQSPNPETTESVGTVFHVLLSFEKTMQPDDGVVERKGEASGRRVLVFETNPLMARLYSEILNDHNMDPVPVVEPEKFWEIMEKQKNTQTPVTDILLNDPDRLINTASIRNQFAGRIIVMEIPGMAGSESSMENETTNVIRIRKPLKNNVLIRSLLGSGEKELKKDSIEGQADAQVVSRESLKILLVEDNKMNQKVTLKMLTRLGHQALLAENGKQALEILEAQNDVDVVFMDGQMPVMNGFEATGIIRRKEEKEPGKHHIPIIALTANAMKGDRHKYIEAGMDDYIAKPVRIQDLLDVIQRVRHNPTKDLPVDVFRDISEF